MFTQESKFPFLLFTKICLIYLCFSSFSFATHTVVSKVDLQLGMGFYSNETHSRASITTTTLETKTRSTGEVFLAGVQLSEELFPERQGATVGFSLGCAANLNRGKSYFYNNSHNNVDITEPSVESLRFNHKFNADLKLGWLSQTQNHFFLKAGGALGEWVYDGRYLGYSANTKKYQWGWSVGGGIDIPLTKYICLGASLAHETYAKMKGFYTFPGLNSFAQWTVKPRLTILGAHVQYKF